MKAYPETFEQAVVYESDAAKLVGISRALRNKKTPPDEATLALQESIQAFVPPGRYKHFKSTEENPKFYEVLGVEEDVNTGLYYVRYASEYGVMKGRPALRILVGGNDSFLRPIDRASYKGVRFMRMDDVLEID